MKPRATFMIAGGSLGLGLALLAILEPGEPKDQRMMPMTQPPVTKEFAVKGKPAIFSSSTRPRCIPIRGQFVQAGAIESFYSDDTVLLVVKDKDTHRAYPIRWLDTQELILDTVGGEELLITYCGLTHSPVVYKSTGQITVQDIEDSGYIFESNLVLRDRATGSLWQQISGECLTGPLAGNKLHIQPSFVAVFGAVKEKFPEMLVMLEPPRDSKRSGFPNILPNGLPANLSPYLLFPVSSFETRLPTKERVFGFTVNDDAVAVPMAGLSQQPQTNMVGEVKFRTTPYLGSHIVEVHSRDGWQPINTQLCFWFAWYIGHPNTLVVEAKAGTRLL